MKDFTMRFEVVNSMLARFNEILAARSDPKALITLKWNDRLDQNQVLVGTVVAERSGFETLMLPITFEAGQVKTRDISPAKEAAQSADGMTIASVLARQLTSYYS